MVEAREFLKEEFEIPDKYQMNLDGIKHVVLRLSTISPLVYNKYLHKKTKHF